MISLSFNQLFYYFLVGWQRYGGEDGLQILPKLTIFGAPLLSRVAFYIASVAILAACVAIVQTIRVSRFGQIIRAISQNERRVVALGLYPLPYKLATFVISGILASLAGILLAASQQFISPSDLSWIKSGQLVVMVVLGGTALPWGPLAGAAAYLGFELLLSSITDYWQFCLGGALVILITFFRAGLTDLWTACSARIIGAFR
jgi:branched-chain amino acid transport system permease protein